MPLSFETIYKAALVDETHFIQFSDGRVFYYMRCGGGGWYYRAYGSTFRHLRTDLQFESIGPVPLRPDVVKTSIEDDVFIEMTRALAKLSKCVSLDVAAIAVNESGRVVSTGVNGTPSGYTNCCELHTESGPEHSEWSLEHEIHAEMNLILQLARSGQTFKKGKIYSTHSPCQNCLKHLIGLQQKGILEITDIIFAEKYYKVSDEYLKKQIDFASKFKVNLRLHVPSGK